MYCFNPYNHAEELEVNKNNDKTFFFCQKANDVAFKTKVESAAGITSENIEEIAFPVKVASLLFIFT